MDDLRIRQKELKNDLESIFKSVSEIADVVQADEEKYNNLLSSYMNSLEEINNKDSFKKKLETLFYLLEELVKKAPKISNMCKDVLENYDRIIETYDHVERQVLFSSLQNISEGNKKVRNLIKEINYLYQYDDILSQSFLSYDEILDVLNKVSSGEIKLQKTQILKLKILFSSIIVSIFDMFEDTLALIDNKLFRIGSIFKNSRSYVKTILEVLNNEHYEFFKHVKDISSIGKKIGEKDRESVEDEIFPILTVADWNFFDTLYGRLSEITQELKVVTFEINVLLNKTMLDSILSAIDLIFEELFLKAVSDAEEYNFNKHFMSLFKIKEHKEILIGIFEDEEGADETVLDDGIEFF